MTLDLCIDHGNIDETILYILELDIDNQRVYKIGITTRKIEDRVVEILTSHFAIYRHFPYCRPKRFRKTPNAYEYEQALLKFFKEYKFESYHPFGGSTELIAGINLDYVVQVYEQIMDTGELPKECDESQIKTSE